ncbi:alpha-mannosidase 2 [Copidosoma floridanum]|uniref:alpha-mannosidase 2 n=1 Tax=Copidosoma floridanum TaxID=29053 RepID=UPI0006C94E8F|nr:alpha-mannosidase 2 [Copidosoma floridanum]XP_014204164.1 alpha-mannosidase 2 [Copidosoma floridanum]
MKAKKLFAALGAGLLVACCIMIYLILDVTFLPQNRGTKTNFQDNQWLHFENRLLELENKFKNHHHEAASQVKKKRNGETAELDDSTGLHMKSGEPSECTVNFRQLPEVDIQMLDIYNQLKFDNPDGGSWKQGWDIRYNEREWSSKDKLQVFVVPHSHNDPGWLNTFEKYYSYQTQGVLDNMVHKLASDSRKKFIWAEISYLKLWWDDQSQATRETVKQLVHDGQLEIVAGGYVMPDEAVSHWMAQLTQLTEGHQWLKANLDYIPKTGWAIDPFGLSPTMPYLLKKAGLENTLIQRVHYSVKKKLAQDKHLEFRWRQLWDNDGSSEIFTHMMPFYSYDIPHSCGPDPKICCQFDFYRLPSFGFSCPWKIPPKAISKSNVGKRAAVLLEQYRKKSELYRSNVVLAPLGDDFRYSHVTEWDAQFNNYQKLFDYMNSDRQMNVHIQFGTLKDYFEAVRRQEDVNSYPSLSGDFFTYSDRDDNYWSGYYTSRPFHKRLDRVLLGALRGSELMATIAWMQGNDLLQERMAARLDVARRWHSLFQHHDGVTGTARDHVVVDYAQKMIVALNNSAHILQQSIMHLMRTPQKAALDLDDTYLSLDKTRSYHTSPGDKYVISLGSDIPLKKVLFYNSLPRSRTRVESVYVSTPYVRVTDRTGRPITCQISPVWVSPAAMSAARYELSFLVTIPAFGVTTYVVHSLHGQNLPEECHLANVTVYNTAIPLSVVPGFDAVQTFPRMQEFSISQRPELSASFGNQGLLKALRIDEMTHPVRLEFVKYGTRGVGQDRSGAYLFLPDKPEPDPVFDNNHNRIVHLITGPIFSRVFTDLPHVKHICTLYNSPGSDGLGLHITNEVDVTETQNFELAMRINTNIASGDVFYTDLNGLNMIKRQRFSKIPTQGNFYPLAAAGYISDDDLRMTIVTGQPLGASSMSSGQFEIIQDRKLMQDDNRGLSQGVTDNLLTFHQFTLILEKRQKNCAHSETPSEHPAGLLSLAGHLSLDDMLHPITGLHPRQMAPLNLNPNYSALGTNFPVDLSVVSLRVIDIPDGAGKGVGLVLHRQGLSLCWGDKSLQQRFPVSKTGDIDLSKFIVSMQDWTISKTPLTFTKVESSLQSPMVSLCPHELLSLLFYKS